MAAFEPFEPAIKTGVAGLTVLITAGASGTSVPSTVNSTGAMNPSLLVTNIGSGIVWVRMSNEAVPVATQADTPVLGNSVRLFANPNPTGVTGVAVVVSVTSSPNLVYFTAGEGGLN